MSKYGSIYKTTDFVKRLLRKNEENTFTLGVLKFLQDLGQFQENNPLVTLHVHTGDGIWVNYDGEDYFFIKPTQKYLLFHIFSSNGMSLAIEKQESLFVKDNERKVEYAYKVWKIYLDELKWIINYMSKNFKQPNYNTMQENDPHPRFIPGHVRQAVLEEFNRTGRYCSGVAGSKKHKVAKNSPIEFDHILPYAHGGSNSYVNVQILCKECNRKKGSKAT